MSEVTPTLAVQSSGSFVDAISITLGLLFIVAFIFLPWVYTFVSVLKRTDLKESKLLWIILLFVIGPITPVLYAFMENRKKIGLALIGIYIVLPLIGLIAVLVA